MNRNPANSFHSVRQSNFPVRNSVCRAALLATATGSFAIANFAAITVHGATKTWDGGGTGGTELGTAMNWSGDMLPVNSDIRQWEGTVAGALSLT